MEESAQKGSPPTKGLGFRPSFLHQRWKELRVGAHLHHLPRWLLTIYLMAMVAFTIKYRMIMYVIFITMIINLVNPVPDGKGRKFGELDLGKHHRPARIILIIWDVFLGFVAVAVWISGKDIPEWVFMAAVNGFALFLIFYTIWLVYRLLSQRQVAWSSFLVAICVYMIIAYTCALIYAQLYYFDPSQFDIHPDLMPVMEEDPLSVMLYFSIVTMTTLGYGDVTPLGDRALDVTTVEAIIGQMYVAVVVAWLVGLRLANSIDKAEKSGRRRLARYVKLRNGRRVRR